MKTKLFIGPLLFGALQLTAQEATVSAGGNATGTGGTVSYTLGQMVYTTNTGASGSVAQGVQQPFEIQAVLGIENLNINLQLAVYPNPTTNWLALEVKNHPFEKLQYQLFDLNGRQLRNSNITTENTAITLEQYPSAVYLLKILDNNKEVKTFKILKK